jgi:predicted Zn-dependent peptidase
VYVAAGVKLAEARVAWVTPAYGTQEDAALDVAAAILAGRGAGWLNQVLMGEPRLCTSVNVAEDSKELASVFEIRATVAEGHSLNEVLDAIQRAIVRFGTSVTDEEAERGKHIWYNTNLFGLSSTLAWAQRLALDARRGPLPARFDGRLGHHASVRPAEVRSAVRTWLALRPPVVVLSNPRPGAPVSGVVTQWKELRP